MRIFCYSIVILIFCIACDSQRVYEKYTDFDQHQWLSNNHPEFEFQVDDITTTYNVYANVRNTVSYPYARLFFNYYLVDSTNATLKHELKTTFLFDAKTGKPLGQSGIGDLYDQQFILLNDYQFKQPGKYAVVLEQFMRLDTLEGITAVGVRVEKTK